MSKPVAEKNPDENPMRRLILWLILTTFVSCLALEAAQPWTPVRARGHATVKVKKIRKRHQRKKKHKKRKRRQRRRTTAAIGTSATGSLAS